MSSSHDNLEICLSTSFSTTGDGLPINDDACIVKVKRAGGYRDYQSARFHISVGQSYHEGNKFSSTMDWATENFDKIIICVNDTLQRHNLIFDGKSPDEAFDMAHDLGTEWVKRNTLYISSAMQNSDNVQTVRWESWHKHPEFERELEKVQRLYRGNEDIRSAIQNEAMAFWQRRKGHNGSGNGDNYEQSRFLDHSVEYLIEECAIFSIMFREEPPSADIYPGSSLLPCRLFKDGISNSKYGFTKIEFRPASKAATPDSGFKGQHGRSFVLKK